MKKSVCAVYFPGVISLLKLLPATDFDLILTDAPDVKINDEAVEIIEGEGIIWQRREYVAKMSPDYFIDESSDAYGNVSAFMKLLATIRYGERVVELKRKTNETNISIKLDLDGTEASQIDTGIGFFDHMLAQLSQHGGLSLEVIAAGDLNVDEHHTVEDVGILLGEAFYKVIGSKMGIARYGFTLPMDECQSEAVIDFGGRSELVWNVVFNRERIGDMPTEMFKHFFKSFATSAKCSLHISSIGENEHHKIEGVFKAFARAVKAAVKRDVTEYKLPTTKGIL